MNNDIRILRSLFNATGGRGTDLPMVACRSYGVRMGGSRGEWVSVLVTSGGPWRGEGEVVSE